MSREARSDENRPTDSSRSWRVSPLSGWHVGGGSSSSETSQRDSQLMPQDNSTTAQTTRRSRWRAPLVSSTSTGMGSGQVTISASLANCLPAQGGADEGVHTAEDGESEGSGGAHLMPPASRTVDDVKLTGWLYKHRKGHFRQQWYRRFFVLRGTHLAYYKTSPWQQETPVREIVLSARCRVEDSGRWTTTNKELYTFCLHSNEPKPLLVGTKDPELAAAWIQAVQQAIQRHNGIFDALATPLSTHTQAASSNASWASDEEDEEFQSTHRDTLFSWVSSESMEADAQREGGHANDRPLEEEEEEDEEDYEGEHPRGNPGRTPGDAPGLPGAGMGGGGGAGAGAVPFSARVGAGVRGGRETRGGTEAVDRASADGAGGTEHVGMYPDDRRRGSVGFGPPQELGGMLEAIVAMGNASTATGIAGDGSWRLVRLANGLRFFEETVDNRAGSTSSSERPCLSSVGTVDAPCEAVFRLVMDLSPASRYEWDVAYDAARVVEVQDGHTDCVHYKFKTLPLGPLAPLMHLGPRDLCLRRYWQRRADGCYVVLYQSMEHRFCPPVPSCVRAEFTYGGFFIAPAGSPSAPSSRCIVMHVLDIDPKGWMPQCCGYRGDLHFFLLGRVAGIRDFFAQTRGVAVSSLLGLPLGQQYEPSAAARAHRRRKSSAGQPKNAAQGAARPGGERALPDGRRPGQANGIPDSAAGPGGRGGGRKSGPGGVPQAGGAAGGGGGGGKGTGGEVSYEELFSSMNRSSSLKDMQRRSLVSPPGASTGPQGRASPSPSEGLLTAHHLREGGGHQGGGRGGGHTHQQHREWQEGVGGEAGAHQRSHSGPQGAALDALGGGAREGAGVPGADTGHATPQGHVEGERGAEREPLLPVAQPLEGGGWGVKGQAGGARGMGGMGRRGRAVDRGLAWAWAEKGGSLGQGSAVSGINCWSEADEGLFSVRSRTYLEDKVKQPAATPSMVLVAVDWLRRIERIDHVVDLKETPVQMAREKFANLPEAERPYFFIVNLQVPGGHQNYSMAFYWTIPQRPQPGTLLARFAEGDDLFRNARLKLIPRIHKGAWVVKRSVGTTPLIIAGALTVAYHQGPDYIECDVDIGSSSVANGIVRFVLGYVRTLVVDMAFLFQSNTEEELPEDLLGTVRVNHLEPNAALDLDLDSLKPQPQ